ncbi:hypothetical protein NQ317_017807 [Molorchus minor]|uniref:Uncharacterized protein n=1 Tax=Molorchus minor TaxID=1323400 RepID=A0ABQ9K3R8_9CUCU|nr:hypothetical protein NQ317_017807 [Molorchus minor]
MLHGRFQVGGVFRVYRALLRPGRRIGRIQPQHQTGQREMVALKYSVMTVRGQWRQQRVQLYYK